MPTLRLWEGQRAEPSTFQVLLRENGFAHQTSRANARVKSPMRKKFITRRPTSPYAAPTRAQIEKARAMYVEKFTIARILAAADMSLGTLYYWLDGGPREAEGPFYPPLPRRRVVVGKRRPLTAAAPRSLAARLLRSAERQARDIEERLARPQGAAGGVERERDVRMLALLTRSLRELAAFTASTEIADTADDGGTAALAAERDAREQKLREAETGASTAAHALRALRALMAAELARNKAALRGGQPPAMAEADAAALRAELGRRMQAVAAADAEARGEREAAAKAKSEAKA